MTSDIKFVLIITRIFIISTMLNTKYTENVFSIFYCMDTFFAKTLKGIWIVVYSLK